MKLALTEKQLKVLLDLGLSKTQSTLYLTSLEHGILSVLELSKLTKINRQQIYAEAEKLIDLGIYELTRKQGKKYIPANPSKLIKIAKKKIEETEEILTKLSTFLPQLEALSSSKKNKIVVKYFEGSPKIREAYDEELDIAKHIEILSFGGSIDNVFEFLPESYLDKWNERLLEQSSTSKVLVHDSEIARRAFKKHKGLEQEVRCLTNFPLNINIDIFNDTVLIVSFKDELAVWIESKILAESYRIMFNSFWEFATPLK